MTGRTEIDEYWSGIENPIDWRLDIRKIRGSDALAYEFGTSHLVTRREGVVHTSVVDFLVLWRRDAQGAWRIALDAYWPVEKR
jgi:ketosteroid isomerase-like protein